MKIHAKQKYIPLIIFVYILSASSIFSQNNNDIKNINTSSNGTVKGIISDSLTKAPIQYASIQLISISDTSKLFGTISGKEGRFELLKIPFGSYSVKVSSVGYKKRKRNLLILNSKVRTIDLDTISLAQKNILIGEVQISEEKETVVYEKEKLIINVSKELGDNGIEILENTPAVNVDIEGNVSLKGKHSTAIYIDGIPLKLAGFEKAEDLKLLSVSDIEKIEIITTPSSEFAESGDAGTINIITKKKFDGFYSGKVSIGDNTRNNFNSVRTPRYSTKPLSMRGSYTYNNSENNSITGSLKTVTLNNLMTYLNQTKDIQRHTNLHEGMFSLFYNPDKYNNFSGTLNYKSRNIENLQKQLTSQNIYGIDSIINFTNRINGNTSQQFFTLSMNYMKSYSDSKKKFSISLNYNNNAMNSETGRDQSNSSKPGISTIKNDLSANINNTLNLRSSYFNPITKSTSYSIGYYGSFTGLTMKNNYFVYDAGKGLFNEDNAKKNDYKNSNSRNTIYGAFSSSFWETDYTVKIEYQHYWTNFEENLSGNSFMKKYSNFLPGISIRKQLAKSHGINLSYGLSCSYPINRQINPHVDYSDTTNIVMGNPDLEPTYSSSFSAAYNYFSENALISLISSYSKQENLIETITSQKNATTSITTFQNIAAAKRLSIVLFGGLKIFRFWSIDPSVSWSSSEY